jgi:hypothetical protein
MGKTGNEQCFGPTKIGKIHQRVSIFFRFVREFTREIAGDFCPARFENKSQKIE